MNSTPDMAKSALNRLAEPPLARSFNSGRTVYLRRDAGLDRGGVDGVLDAKNEDGDCEVERM
jgi:hypothetical protein